MFLVGKDNNFKKPTIVEDLAKAPIVQTAFPEGIKFKYTWRKYQQRVLDELEEHLNDDHLHVIAPPGSGKTVLGLEVARRLNKPTLILAPTIALRNQWIQRFCELFLQTEKVPDWISRDIRKPAFMTVVTYQGLHAACNNQTYNEEEEEEEVESEEEETKKNKTPNQHLDIIVNGLLAQQVKTIVVDEAHHLKNEWWHTLIKVKNKLSPVVVGLTATPPYDVTYTEWQRYLELNGPVDTEITVPELIAEGDLCPHQDYVYFSMPTAAEYQKILAFRNGIERFFEEVKSDPVLIQALQQHPVYTKPEKHLEWIYGNVTVFSSFLIFLHANEVIIPEMHLDIIGDKEIAFPKLDFYWIEILLDFYLYKEKEHFSKFQEHQELLENKLRRYGAVEQKRINLGYNRRVTGSVTSSISKLKGIEEITDFEYKQLGGDLRMVILSDFIRKEFLVSTDVNHLELNKIGVIPIFEKLRRNNTDHKKLGVLTGSVVILPLVALPAVELKAQGSGINAITTTPLAYDSNYVVVHQTEQLKHAIVHIVTQVFQEGGIQVLIGTKSLLGEGWDAPAINSLILASFVGSFVSSNQMRGRAIRIQNGNVFKTGNVWHLVCLEPGASNGGDDFEVLKRRFKGFVGISAKEGAGIENGIARLNLSKNLFTKEGVEVHNNQSFLQAANRALLGQRWEEAIKTGVSLVEEIKVPFKEDADYQALKKLYYNKTISYLIGNLIFGLIIFCEVTLKTMARSVRLIRTLQDLYMAIIFIGVVGLIIFGRKAYKAFNLYLNYRDISKDVQHIGETLLQALIKAEIIHTTPTKLKVVSSVDQEGAVYCHLEGGTTFEKSSFINALQEIIGPIDNPRYVLIRRSEHMFFLKQQDYHSVPEVLGRNKALAEYFMVQWLKMVGNCELVFTRTLEGRKLLLQARVKALAAQFEQSIDHVNKWR